LIRGWLRHPIAVWSLLFCIHVVAVLGVLRLSYDDGLIRTFESDLQRFRDYTAYIDRFESDGRDVLILFEGRDMAEPKVLGALTDFLLDLQFVEGVSGVISPFGLRVVSAQGQTEPLVPDPIPPLEVMQARFDAERATGQDLSRVLSKDRTMMLVMVPLGDAAENIEMRGRILAEVNRLAGSTATATGLRVTVTGYPVLRDRISKAIFADLILLTAIGTAVGIAVASLSLRSLTLGLLTTVAPLTSLLWVLAMLGFLGVEINVITVALPVLIMVLATSDAIHLSLEVALMNQNGEKRPEIMAVRRIAPACILAALTTAVAFGALTLSSSTLITDLGKAGAIGTLMSVFAVLVTHPAVFHTAAHIVGRDRLFAARRGQPPSLLNLSALPVWAGRAPGTITAAAIAMLALSAVLYVQIEPRYSLFGDLRAGDEGVAALRRIDTQLFPTGAMHIPVKIAGTEGISAAHSILVAEYGRENVFSLAAFADRAAAAGQSLDEVLNDMPEPLARRLVSKDGHEAVVSVLFPYVDSQDTQARTNVLEAQLALAAPKNATFGRATGIAVMASFVSHDVLTYLNVSFLISLLAAGALIAVWLRRPLIAVVSLLPNVLPIACIGAWLAVSGAGLGFASGLALIIAFGLAVDDTVHVLNRLRLAQKLDTLYDARAVCDATREVAPALVITSLVLAMGMMGTFFAQLVTVTTFGALSIAVFVLALLADLLILPSCLIVLGRLQLAFGNWRMR